MQKGLSLYAKIQLDLGAERSAYSSQQQMLSQCSSAAVLAGQRVAQASQAKLCRKIITNGFRSTRLLRQKTFQGDQLSSQLGREQLRQARPTVPLGKLGCKIKTNGF
jgi:hypothetical protein